jgi:hypothetical protein
MFGLQSELIACTLHILCSHISVRDVCDCVARGHLSTWLHLSSSVAKSDVDLPAAYPDEAVNGMKAVHVSHIFEHVRVKVSLCEVKQPCHLGIGSIGNIA